MAEPVVYMIDRYVVGGFYRVHTESRQRPEPERAGHAVRAAAFASSARLARSGPAPGTAAPNRFYTYGVVARLALLAASVELEQTDPEASGDHA